MRSISTAFFVLLASCSSEPTNPGGTAGGGGGTGTIYFGRSVDLEIHKLNLATGETVKLGKGDAPRPTPEGTLVFITPVDLNEANEDLSSHRAIVKGSADVEKSNDGFDSVQVSPDGTRIVYTTLGNNMYVVKRADGTILSRFEVKGVTEGWFHATWTPDGRVVAAGGSGNEGLYLSNENVTGMRRFDPMLSRPRDAAVSPDGSRVVFVLNDRLHTIGLDGTGLKKIDTSDDKDELPAWSPDGGKVIYRVGGRLKIISAEGGTGTDLFDMFPALKDKFLILNGSHPVVWK